MPASIDMHTSTTHPPPLLTEVDLIQLMDKNGIGGNVDNVLRLLDQERMQLLLNTLRRSWSVSML